MKQDNKLLNIRTFGVWKAALQEEQITSFWYFDLQIKGFTLFLGGVETGSMYVQYKFFKFRGCLEAASENTNVPLSSARLWTPFHHPFI